MKKYERKLTQTTRKPKIINDEQAHNTIHKLMNLPLSNSILLIIF